MRDSRDPSRGRKVWLWIESLAVVTGTFAALMAGGMAMIWVFKQWPEGAFLTFMLGIPLVFFTYARYKYRVFKERWPDAEDRHDREI